MEKTICNGFKCAGVSAGIKKNGAKDLCLIYSEEKANAAGVFTNNLVKAAPVLLDMERIKNGRARAVIVNSGNANCCNGEDGMKNVLAITRKVADILNIDENEVLAASTGVIGMPFPVHMVEKATPGLVEALSPEGFIDAAEAIMTTDTTPKCVSIKGKMNGKPYTIVGMAKGAGMIRPDMATLLSFICTDLDIAPDILQQALKKSADKSYNRITIDGDTSTNDTLLILANGCSGVRIETQEEMETFQRQLDDLTRKLAVLLVKDGEGVTKCVHVHVKGALSDDDAFKIADTVSHSPLVKTAFFGEDANWGRIIAAIGRAGVAVSSETIDIYFDDVQMVKNSTGLGPEAEEKASAVLKKSEFTVTVDLNNGNGAAELITCDMSIDYIKINADYRS